MAKQLPGNAFDWIGRAQDIANRIFHFRGLGFIMLADRTAGDPWTIEQKKTAQAILFQVERDATRRILDKWLTRGKIRPCATIQDFITGKIA